MKKKFKNDELGGVWFLNEEDLTQEPKTQEIKINKSQRRKKFKIGDSILIKVCDLVGIIVSIETLEFAEGISVKYDAVFPDRDGFPSRGTFSEIELELVETDRKLGFRKN